MAVLEKGALLREERLQATGFRLQQTIDLMPVAFTHLWFSLSANRCKGLRFRYPSFPPSRESAETMGAWADDGSWLCRWCSSELGITFGRAIVALVRAGRCGRASCLVVHFRATGGRSWGP